MMHILTQIWRFVLQPKVWRFVGFASAVVGLLCYALSSSFNFLFGNWNLWKIILYTVFSLIISLMIFYANIWKSSTSLRLKANTAFLVLTLTSVYSFFYDKIVNGKPDAFSLISCASFAIMSLSLSRQTQFGFEIDLLYFFLGCLIVQLMKISLQLLILGAGFSYSLVILRSSLSSIDVTIKNQNFDPQGENSVRVDVEAFLLQRQLKNCIKEIKEIEKENLLDLFLKLVKEYKQQKSELHLLDTYHYIMNTLSSSGKIDMLNEIVKSMVRRGHKTKCYDEYSSWRRGFFQECLFRNKIYGLPKANINTIPEDKREKYLDTMIETWKTASDVAMTILFPIEQELHDSVFSGSSSNANASSCFVEVFHEETSQLLYFADAFASGNPSKWRLFKMLNIFEHLCNLFPKLQSLFPASTLLERAITVEKKLGKAIRDLFMEMPNVIFRVQTAKNTVLSHGDTHPITSEVMSYVSHACMSREKLEQILQAYPEVGSEVEVSSLFLEHMKQMEQILIAELKNFEDPALSHIFMVNNRSHIEAINQFSKLERSFGCDWFQKNREQIQQNIEDYKRISWDKVVAFLDNNDNITEELLKEKIHLFNNHFREICRVQSDWFVYDNSLREEIISSVENVLLPAYGSFTERLRNTLGNQAYEYEYIKYGIGEIKVRLNELFKIMQK